jgi:uncharacterized RDD family membrane protein YckC
MIQSFTVTDELCASGPKRALTYIIDVVVQYMLIFLFGFIAAMIAQVSGNDALLDWLGNMGRLDGYAIGIAVFLIYYNALEILSGRTVGKWITGTIVVDLYGGKPGASRILKRTLCRLIPFEFLTFIRQRRGWHDTIPDLYVVNKREFEEVRQRFSEFHEIGSLETAL